METTMKIYGKVYRVCILEFKDYQELGEYTKQEAEDTLGFHMYKTSTIGIKKKQNEDIAIETFIHECTHAIYSRFGYNQTKFDDEFLCDFISAHIIELNRLKEMFTELIKGVI